MKQEQIIMGTPVIVEINNKEAKQEFFDEVFNYFKYVDEKFSTYKNTSEISRINSGEIEKENFSGIILKAVFAAYARAQELSHE